MFLISFLQSLRHRKSKNNTACSRFIFSSNKFTVIKTSLRAVDNRSVAMTSGKRYARPCRLETPLCARASYTIEASIVLPLFISLMAMCIFFGQMIAIQWGVSHALEETVKEAARIPDDFIPGTSSGDSPGEAAGGAASGSAASEGESSVGISDILTYGAFVFRCNEKITDTGVPVNFITGGVLGLNYSETEIGPWEIKGKVTYHIKLPLPLIGRHAAVFTAASTSRRWVGWNPAEGAGDEGTYVYVTPTGRAFHNNMHCVYLDPHMYAVPSSTVGSKRNASGAIYHSCSVCHPDLSSAGSVFISDYGTVYHGTLTCTTLKRTIQRVTMEEAAEDGYHACPKCGSGG